MIRLKFKILLFCFIVVLTDVSAQENLNTFYELTNHFFKKHVKDGEVNYAQIKASDRDELFALEKFISEENLEGYNAQQKKAFYINSYNILVISSVVEHYPTRSPQSINGFFDTKKHTVAGEQITLNQLEKQRLLSVDQDARLHFALICAAKGCPQITSLVFRHEKLDQQLDAQASRTLNNSTFVRVNDEEKKVALSEIFKWYKSDFTRGGLSEVGYINKYRGKRIESDYGKSYYIYDWSLNETSNGVAGVSKNSTNQDPDGKNTLSNVQAFTPSVLLKKGQFEINNFNNLYSQTAIRNADGDKVDVNGRESFVGSLVQFTYGVSKSSRINVGWDVMISAAYYDNDDGPILELFSPKNGNFNRTVISGTGPRVKVAPFKNLTNLSIQSSLLIPVSDNLESPSFTAHDRYTWNTQFFYDQALSTDFRIFFEADFLYRIKRRSDQFNFFRTPLTTVISYFPTTNSTLYGLFQHAPAFGKTTNNFDTQFGKLRWYTQYGVGAKYQLTPRLGIEVSYTDFFASKSDGAGKTYNLGLRYIR